jgi:ElaB/YqjD/DUF883 family membrane-anchored ribosome-binding protein
MMNATERNWDFLRDDLQEVVRDVEGLLKGIPDDVSEEARKARRRLEATMESVKHQCHRLERRAVAGIRTADAWAHDRPYLVAGGALGLGVLLGALFSCRR